MHRLPECLAAALILSSLARACNAQAAPANAPIGMDRVRVTAPSLWPTPLHGRLVAIESDTAIIRLEDGRTRLYAPLASMESMEIASGRPRLQWAAVGGGAGAVLGAVVGTVIGAQGNNERNNNLSGLGGLIAGMLAGGTAGTVGGALFAPRRWRMVDLRPHSAVGQPAFRLEIEPGAEIRTKDNLGDEAMRVDRFERFTGDSLYVAGGASGATVSYPLHTLASLEVRGGRDARRGVPIGAAVGGALALAFDGIDSARGNLPADQLVASVAGNALLGAVLGYIFAPRGWMRVPVPGAR